MRTRFYILFSMTAVMLLAGSVYLFSSRTPAQAADNEPYYLERGWFPMHKQATVKLSGNSDWINTRVNVIPGHEIRIISNGLISFKSDYNRTPLRKLSPNGDKNTKQKQKAKDNIHYFSEKFPMPDATPFILVGRIVDHKGKVQHGPFEIGKDKTFVIPKEGNFQVTTNDDNKSDNTGFWRVTILLRKQSGIEPFGKAKPEAGKLPAKKAAGAGK